MALLCIWDTSEMGNYCNGVVPEWIFPYQGSSAVPCSAKPAGWETHLVSMENFGAMTQENITVLKNLIIQEGPLASLMNATPDFVAFGMDNHSPTAYYPYVSSDVYNHGIVIVGWHDDPAITHGGYWICKNSWGTNWGYDGFFNIEYGGSNIAPNGLVYWVDPGSIVIYVDDSNTQGPWFGSYEHPFQTIQAGVNLVRDNDTVYVFNGTYHEHVYINKSIKLIGENKHTTIVDGDYAAADVMHIPPGTERVQISGFTIQHAGAVWYDGIHVNSGNNIITGNIITNNTRYGIFVHSSNGNIISDNTIMYTSDGPGPRDGYGIVDYHFNEQAGNTTIINNTITRNDYGIDLSYSLGSHIMSNTILNNRLTGVALWDTNGNTIIGNTITDHHVYGGIWMTGSQNNIISDNTINNNVEGIFLYTSPGNSILRNWIYDNGHGVHLRVSSNNNLIYHNVLFDNDMDNAYDECSNTWDNGYPSGGNYWDDYTGSDTHYGMNQDIPNSDGIGDTPYVIPGGTNHDSYPVLDEIVDSEYIEDIQGTIRYNNFEGGFYGIVAADGRHFDPFGLPDEYHVDGLNCLFTGRIVDLVDSHMWGSNIYLTEFTPQDTYRNEPAIIRYRNLEGGFYYLDLVNSETNLFPLNLPVTYRVNGMTVTVSGYPLNVATPYMFGQPFHITAIVDTTPPVTQCAVHGNTITLSATDAGSGVAITKYTLAIWINNHWELITPPHSWATYRGPISRTPGRYLINYYSIDNANNRETVRQSIFTITVVIITPNGGETWQRGSTQTIQWESADNTPSTMLLSVSSDGGKTWTVLTSAPNTPGKNNIITTIIPKTLPSSSQCLLKIESTDPKNPGYDISDKVFTMK